MLVSFVQDFYDALTQISVKSRSRQVNRDPGFNTGQLSIRHQACCATVRALSKVVVKYDDSDFPWKVVRLECL